MFDRIKALCLNSATMAFGYFGIALGFVQSNFDELVGAFIDPTTAKVIEDFFGHGSPEFGHYTLACSMVVMVARFRSIRVAWEKAA